MRSPRFGVVFAISAASCAVRAQDDCTPELDLRFGGGSFNGGVYCMCAYDDGNGPAVYLGGKFTKVGGLDITRIVKWDGGAWSDLGGLSADPTAMVVWDPPGPDKPVLVVSGGFATAGGKTVNGLATWDGKDWNSLGGGMFGVNALTVANIGDGEKLYLGGSFTFTPDGAANRVASWDGAHFAALGSGINSPTVLALAAYDDGGGPGLYAAGLFSQAGGNAASNIARWRGGAWTTLGSGVNNQVNALCIYDGFGSPSLIAGGTFTTAGGAPASRVARWDGNSWFPIDNGIDGPVNALTSYVRQDNKRFLAATGFFNNAGNKPAKNIAAFDSVAWSNVGLGIDNFGRAFAPNPFSVFADILVGGDFTKADGYFSAAVAETDGSGLDPMFTGADNIVRDVFRFDDGSGVKTYFAGDFNVIGGIKAPGGVARYDGKAWEALPGLGVGGVWKLQKYDYSGDGVDDLIAGGRFQNLADNQFAKCMAGWDFANKKWIPIGGVTGGQFPTVADMFTFQDKLVVTGQFTSTTDGANAANIAVFDPKGRSQWLGLGQGLTGQGAYGSSLQPWTLNGAETLVVGGKFSAANGHAAGNLAVLKQIVPIDFGAFAGGVDADVFSMTSWVDNESGDPVLCLGGKFTTSGDGQTTLNHIGLVRGFGPIEPLGFEPNTGVAFPVSAVLALNPTYESAGLLLSLDTGAPPYQVQARIATDEEWETPKKSYNADSYIFRMNRLWDFNIAPTQDVWIGGGFATFDGKSSAGFAHLACSGALCYPDLDGNGSLDLFDFLSFVNLFNAHAQTADCVDDNAFDLFDFLCFVNAFNAGC